MKKQMFIFLFTLGLDLYADGQTLSMSVLPKAAQKMLSDFAFVAENTFTKGLYAGSDSLQLHMPERLALPSFYINRYEISVDNFRSYCYDSGVAADCPDASIWTSEFPYAYVKPMADHYFTSKVFEEHPVVCVTWDQAVRYCAWKSKQVNALLDDSDYSVEIRLPTEAEWEMAALGPPPTTDKDVIIDRRIFPWEGRYFKTDKNGLHVQCNAGPIRTPQASFSLFDYAEDGHLYTAPVQSFEHNGAGLYQMAGNAAEWTSEHFSFDSLALEKAIEKHPDLLGNAQWLQEHQPSFPIHKYDDFMIVKGGSWADEPFYMQIGVRKIQHPKQASATIGFRPVCVVARKRKE